MIGASAALIISDIPFTDTVSSVSIGYCDGEFVVNPNAAQRETSKLSLTVSSTKDKVMMIEAGADEIPDDVMLAAIKLGHEVNRSVIDFINSIHEKEGKALQEYTEHVFPKTYISSFRNSLQTKQWKQQFTKSLSRKEILL